MKGKIVVVSVVLAVGLAVLGAGAVSVGSWGVGVYNRLITLSESVNSKWSQVENVYQRRYDLVPNLVATVKGYAKHERETFTQVAEARSNAGKIKIDVRAGDLTPENLKKFQAAQGELSSALSRLMVVAEKYPDLKANAQFETLMVQLEGTENRISVERKNYNDDAQEYNTAIKNFPGNLVAKYFGFKEKPYFKMEDEAKKAPKVDFSDPPAGNK